MVQRTPGRPAWVDGRSSWRPSTPWVSLAVRALRDAVLVPGRVAEPGVDAVELIDGLLRDLDATRLELGHRGAAVLDGEDDSAAGALCDHVGELRGQLRRRRHCIGPAQDQLQVGLVGRPDRQPTE